jgi:hypothetical protein
MNPLRWRKITWVLDLWIAAFVIWMIAGVNSSPESCAGPFPSVVGVEYCGPQELGNGQAVAFLVWCLGFIVLLFAWLMTSGPARVQR